MIGSPIGSQKIMKLKRLKYLRYPQLQLDWTTALCFHCFPFIPGTLGTSALNQRSLGARSVVHVMFGRMFGDGVCSKGVSEISFVVSPTASIVTKKMVTKNPFTFGRRECQGFKSQQPKCQTPTPRCGGRPTPWSLTPCNSSRDWIIILGTMFNYFTVQVLLSKRWLSDWILLQLFILFYFGIPKELVATSRYYIPSCHGTSV